MIKFKNTVAYDKIAKIIILILKYI